MSVIPVTHAVEDENLSMLDPVTGVSVFSLSSPDGNESLSLRVEFVTEGSHQIFTGVSIAILMVFIC